jgi:hypothetical protein
MVCQVSYPQVYPHLNLTVDIFIFYEWRKVEGSGEWSTFKRGVRNAAAAKPPFQIFK